MKNSVFLVFLGHNANPEASTNMGFDLELPASWHNLGEPREIHFLSSRLKLRMAKQAERVNHGLAEELCVAKFFPARKGAVATVPGKLVFQISNPLDYLKALNFLVSAGKLAQQSDGVVRIQREESTVSPGIFFYRLIGAPPGQ